jgi:hypothetical protein
MICGLTVIGFANTRPFDKISTKEGLLGFRSLTFWGDKE